MGIFLLTYLCVNIAFRAKARGSRPLPWVLRTVFAAAVTTFLAMVIVVISWMMRYGSTPKDLENMQAMIKSGELALSDWNTLFVLVCTFGGYLFVRYRLDKYPKLPDNGQDGSPPQ